MTPEELQTVEGVCLHHALAASGSTPVPHIIGTPVEGRQTEWAASLLALFGSLWDRMDGTPGAHAARWAEAAAGIACTCPSAQAERQDTP